MAVSERDFLATERVQPRRSELELAFVLAPGQNLFFLELVAALRDELAAVGVAATIHTGDFPAPHEGIVYVLVPPHEFFTLMHGRRGPAPETLARTIFICAEQPDTTFFDENVGLAPRAGAVFDINASAVAAFAERGIQAQHLQIGWTQRWDHSRASDRDIDVAFLGCESDRRSRALASYAHLFARRNCCLIVSDNSRPNWQPSQSFRVDSEKWDLLNRTKVLLNIHQGSSPYFEWLRIVQAISNGAVVVSEHSVDHHPLLAGEHFLTGDVDSLGLQTELLLSDPRQLARLRTRAYETLRTELPLAAGAARLIETARQLTQSAPAPDPEDPLFHQLPADPAPASMLAHSAPLASPSGGNVNAAALRRAMKDTRLDLLDVRRELAALRLGAALGHPPPKLEVLHRSPAWSAAAPRVSVLIALYNYAQHIPVALDSLLACRRPKWELIIVDDGSSDASLGRARDWLASHREVAGMLLRHPVNRGLAHTRNDALAFARGEFSFILDADNEVYPGCLERLYNALQNDPGAAFAYGIHERFRGEQTVGLVNHMPWEPNRLRTGNYIDAMAMLRTSVLREMDGYATDRRLHGWEDYDLWCRVAEAGMRGAFVPEIIARYRTAAHSMLALTNVSATDAYSIIIERCPTLMAGVEPPY